MKIMPTTLEEGALTDEEISHTIRNRKMVRNRRIIGAVAGASIAIGFCAMAPNSWNVDIVGATCVGIGSAIVSHQMVKSRQKKKLGLKKHSIVKRAVFGKGESRPTLFDKAFLAAAIAPLAIAFIKDSDPSVLPTITCLAAYIGKRIFNFIKDKKEGKSESKTK